MSGPNPGSAAGSPDYRAIRHDAQRRLANEELQIEDLLWDPPATLRTAMLLGLLNAVPGIDEAFARTVLSDAGLKLGATLGVPTAEQVRIMIGSLREMRGPNPRWPRSGSRGADPDPET